MYSHMTADPCPLCQQNGLPPLIAGSQATARCCQYCGYVQDLLPSPKPGGKPVPVPVPVPVPTPPKEG